MYIIINWDNCLINKIKGEDYIITKYAENDFNKL
jgi:hypothetical protein